MLGSMAQPLEQGRIQKPSPHPLHSLAAVYAVPCETSMEKGAGNSSKEQRGCVATLLRGRRLGSMGRRTRPTTRLRTRVLQNARLRTDLMFALSRKYGLALYEAICASSSSASPPRSGGRK